jgi:hypothetical protein
MTSLSWIVRDLALSALMKTTPLLLQAPCLHFVIGKFQSKQRGDISRRRRRRR